MTVRCMLPSAPDNSVGALVHLISRLNTRPARAPVLCFADALADADAGRVISIPTKRWKAASIALDAAPRPLRRWVSRVLTDTRN